MSSRPSSLTSTLCPLIQMKNPLCESLGLLLCLKRVSGEPHHSLPTPTNCIVGLFDEHGAVVSKIKKTPALLLCLRPPHFTQRGNSKRRTIPGAHLGPNLSCRARAGPRKLTKARGRCVRRNGSEPYDCQEIANPSASEWRLCRLLMS